MGKKIIIIIVAVFGEIKKMDLRNVVPRKEIFKKMLIQCKIMNVDAKNRG